MASLALQIVQAVEALLKVPAMTYVAANQVRTEPIFPADVETGTALNIELGDENPPDRVVIGFKDRATELKLTAIAAGNTAIADADAVMVEAHARLMADETIGGLCFDLNELGTVREHTANGRRLAVIEKTYLVTYRTTEANL